MKLIFNQGKPGRRGSSLPGFDVEKRSAIPDALKRAEPAALPEATEQDVVRHFTRLSRKNMTDVARRAGVSQSTVSRVIGNHPGISEKTRRTVLDALRETGYKADVLQLVRPEPEEEVRSVTFAMCPLPEQRDPFALEFFSTLADGIREGFAGQNVRLRLETLPAAASELPEEGRNADGVILIGYPSEPLRKRLRRDGIPCVIASGDIYTRFEDMPR